MFFSYFPPKDKTTKPMASVTNANTSNTQAAPVAVTTPTVSSGQPTPPSPIKKGKTKLCLLKNKCILCKYHLSLNMKTVLVQVLE